MKPADYQSAVFDAANLGRGLGKPLPTGGIAGIAFDTVASARIARRLSAK